MDETEDDKARKRAAKHIKNAATAFESASSASGEAVLQQISKGIAHLCLALTEALENPPQ